MMMMILLMNLYHQFIGRNQIKLNSSMMATTSAGGGTSVVDRLVEMFPKHSRSQLQDAFDLCSCTPKSMDWYGLQTRAYKSFLHT